MNKSKEKSKSLKSSTLLEESAIAPVSFDELESFRQQWHQEVLEKRDGSSSLGSSIVSTGIDDSASSSLHASVISNAGGTPSLSKRQVGSLAPSPGRSAPNANAPPFLIPTEELKELSLGSDKENLVGSSVFSKVTPQQLRSWLVYRRATIHERQGNLSNALALYRQALKQNPQAEVEYYKLLSNPQDPSSALFYQHVAAEEKKEKASSQYGETVDAEAFMTYYELEEAPAEALQRRHSKKELVVPRTTAAMLVAENPNKPCFLVSFPDELLATVFKFYLLADVTGLSRLACVCKRFYLLTHEQNLWRQLAEQTWLQRTSLTTDALYSECETKYASDWRELCIHRPRVRRDGVYISRVNYIRVGHDEGLSTQPVHLVTYFRYLFFLTQNTCITFTTTTEPAHVVKTLSAFARWRESGLSSRNLSPQREMDELSQFMGDFISQPANRDRCKGLMYGRWALIGSEGTTIVEQRDLQRPATVFRLCLRLKSSKVGLNNILLWDQYISFPVLASSALSHSIAAPPEDSSTVTEYPLKHLKRFVFSRVKSFV